MKDEGFRHAAAQKDLQFIQKLTARSIITVFFRKAQGIAASSSTGNDRNLVDGIRVI